MVLEYLFPTSLVQPDAAPPSRRSLPSCTGHLGAALSSRHTPAACAPGAITLLSAE